MIRELTVSDAAVFWSLRLRAFTEEPLSLAAQRAESCQTCHMPEGSHRFPGAHDTEFLRTSLAVQFASGRVRVCASVSSLGAGHRVPTGDPFHRLELRICRDADCRNVLASDMLSRRVARTEHGYEELDPSWQVFRDGCPGGESPAQVSARADRVIARLRSVDGPSVVFSSGHFLRALTARWLNLDISAGALFMLSTATLGILGYDHDLSEPAIHLWNAKESSTVIPP